MKSIYYTILVKSLQLEGKNMAKNKQVLCPHVQQCMRNRSWIKIEVAFIVLRKSETNSSSSVQHDIQIFNRFLEPKSSRTRNRFRFLSKRMNDFQTSADFNMELFIVEYFSHKAVNIDAFKIFNILLMRFDMFIGWYFIGGESGFLRVHRDQSFFYNSSLNSMLYTSSYNSFADSSNFKRKWQSKKDMKSYASLNSCHSNRTIWKMYRLFDDSHFC